MNIQFHCTNGFLPAQKPQGIFDTVDDSVSPGFFSEHEGITSCSVGMYPFVNKTHTELWSDMKKENIRHLFSLKESLAIAHKLSEECLKKEDERFIIYFSEFSETHYLSIHSFLKGNRLNMVLMNRFLLCKLKPSYRYDAGTVIVRA